jgi:hypothetical protein
VSKLHITKHTSGKMNGFISINTSSLDNDFCKSCRLNNELICSKCYAGKYESFRQHLKNNLENNSKILSSNKLTNNDIPIINNKYVRLHSFGELYNLNHLMNFISIANKNIDTTFTLFTKRLNLIKEVENLIPKNMIIIASSMHLNIPLNKEDIPERVNKVFTVYDKKSEVTINCSQACSSCMKCYNLEDKTFYINERLK